jgi:hypothetical protein
LRILQLTIYRGNEHYSPRITQRPAMRECEIEIDLA